ncbi:unnamed protein product, partial [Scytosiphon promiscuus]
AEARGALGQRRRYSDDTRKSGVSLALISQTRSRHRRGWTPSSMAPRTSLSMADVSSA